MCGRLNVIDDPGVIELCEGLQIALFSSPIVISRFIRATQLVSLVRQVNGTRRMDSATWWLLLEPSAEGFKPSKYTSFNTRYDKLNIKGAAGYLPYRHSRCVIPVKGFGKTEYAGGNVLHCHDLVAKQGGLLLGGLYREWINRYTGESALSCSVITLAPHPKLVAIHSKAMPLILPQDSAVINAWLDDKNSNTAMFTDLLKPHLPQSLIAQQIDKPCSYQLVAPVFEIEQD